MKKHLSLSKLLKKKQFPQLDEKAAEKNLAALQLQMLRIQQGIWHSKKRAILVFEGFDAAGKGGAIQRLTANLDPRGVHVHPIGPPTASEQGRHYLYRFWKRLPEPGTIAIFDRSWYGRLLVERVDELIPEKRWKEAFEEINEFEATLQRDGIDIVKIFLAIHPDEQLNRFEARLKDPYKQWKLTEDDIKARKNWDNYVQAVDDIFKKTDTKKIPWNLIPADSKEYARNEALKIVTTELCHHGDWMEATVEKRKSQELLLALKDLKKIQKKKSF